ncbi:MAG: glycoside hydrolase family 3 N-terminal domain-containing protein, partial [Actinomycetes bacterium]
DRGDEELAVAAETWGEQLRSAGVDADLAPVADVVPDSWVEVNQPIGRLDRGYGPDVDRVAGKVRAFVRGMDRAGVATAVKHFPGLGRVRGNTDFTARVVDRETTRNDPTLAGFAAAVDADVDLVMMSSATYAEIDPDHRAAFSSMIITGMVRDQLGFQRVVISDDLAAAAVQDLDLGQRASRFLRAGGDLMIVGDPSVARAMADAVRERAEDDERFAARLRDAVTRVLTLKDRRGLADC